MTISRLQRNTLIFTIWTLLYFWFFYWFMEENWDFNIFYAKHWQYIWYEWWYGGWVIQGSYYWMFLVFLFLCIPVWIWSSCFFMSIEYKKYYEKAFWDSIYKRKTKNIHQKDSRIRVKKKKSYKEIRPKPLAGTPQMVAPVQSSAPAQTAEFPTHMSTSNTGIPASFTMPSVGKDEFAPFDLPEQTDTSFEKTEIVPIKEDFVQIMQDSGAAVVLNPKMGDLLIDYVAIAKGTLYYILLDAEKGNWLADEERFNDEDPLWYSEEPIRVSPVTQLEKFQQQTEEQLKKAGIKTKGQVILVKTDGNIINVDDMQETWKDMGVIVARSNVGQPEELPSFTEVFPLELEPETTENIDAISAVFKS